MLPIPPYPTYLKTYLQKFLNPVHRVQGLRKNYKAYKKVKEHNFKRQATQPDSDIEGMLEWSDWEFKTTDNFFNLISGIKSQIWEVQRTPSRINAQTFTEPHIFYLHLKKKNLERSQGVKNYDIQLLLRNHVNKKRVEWNI